MNERAETAPVTSRRHFLDLLLGASFLGWLDGEPLARAYADADLFIFPSATDTFGLGASLVAWLTVALLWVCAAYFLAWMARTESQRAGRYGV